MSRFFNEIPPLFAWLILAVLFNAYALSVYFISRALRRRYRLEHEHDLASVIFGAVGAANGLLLALVIATLWSNFTTVQRNVYTEATQLQLLSGNIAALPANAGRKPRAMLADYANQLLNVELPNSCWPRPRAWSETAPLYNLKLSLVRAAAQSATGGRLMDQIVSNINAAEQLRSERIAAARPLIIWEVWLCISALSAFFLALPPFFLARNPGLHLVLMLLLASALSFLFFIAVRLDDIFCGSTAVDLSPLRYVASSLRA